MTTIAFAFCSLLFMIFTSLVIENAAVDKDLLLSSYGANPCSVARCKNGDCFLFANKTGVVCSCPINKTGPDCSKESLSCYKCRIKARKDCVSLPDGTARCICTDPGKRKPPEICYFPKLVADRQKLCIEGKHDCDLNQQCVNYGRYPGSVLITCLCRSGDRRGENCIDRYNHIEPGEKTSCVRIPGQDPICICKKYGIDPGFCKPIKNMDNDTKVMKQPNVSEAVLESSNTTPRLLQVTAGSNPVLQQLNVSEAVLESSNTTPSLFQVTPGSNPVSQQLKVSEAVLELSNTTPSLLQVTPGLNTGLPEAQQTPGENVPVNKLVRRQAKCPFLNHPENGRVAVEGFDPGNVAAYTCKKGYRIQSGSNYQICQDDYKWSLQPPTCVGITKRVRRQAKCPFLNHPENGRVAVEGFDPGNVAAYTCKKGYRIQSGSNYQKCQDDYKWSLQPPTCVGKRGRRQAKCPFLNHPENGRVAVEGYDPGNVAAYTCKKGYRIQSGSNYQICQDDFKWSLQRPTCVGKRVRRQAKCPSLNHPENGRVSVQGYDPGNVAVYICKKGYSLSGSSNQICQGDFKWSLQPPTCVGNEKSPTATNPSPMGKLENPFANRQKFPSAMTPSPTLKLENPIGNRKPAPFGFTLLPIANRKNFAPVPTPSPTVKKEEPIANGKISAPGPTPSPTVKKEEPIANGRCPFLNQPVNGRVSVEGYSPGHLAAYTCHKGYSLSGSNFQKCQNDYTWSLQPPTCIEKSAPVPTPSPAVKKEEPIANRKISAPVPTPSRAVKKEPIANRKSYLPPPITSPTVKTEQSIANGKCPSLNQPENGRVAVEGYDPGNVAAYTCNNGYSLIGADYQKCQNDYTWSLKTPTCVETPSPTVNLEETTANRKCPSLNHPENGRVAIEGYDPGNVAAFTCKTGYSLIGANYRKCQNDYTWSLQPPDCVEESSPISLPSPAKFEEPFANRECPTLDQPENGHVAVEGYNPGNIAAYTCQSGYSLSGANYRKCQNDYTWSLLSPNCVELSPEALTPSSTTGLEDLIANRECPSLNDPENGRVVAEGYNQGNVAEYICNNEYYLSGAKYRKCQNNYTWSLEPPTCIPPPALTELPPVTKGGEEKKSYSNTDIALIVVSCLGIVLILVILFCLLRKRRADKNKGDITETTALKKNLNDELIEFKREDLNNNWPLQGFGARRLARGYKGRMRTYSAPYSPSITKLNSASHNSRDLQELKLKYLRETLKRQRTFPSDRSRVKMTSRHGLEVSNGNAERMPCNREYFDDMSKIEHGRIYYGKRSTSSVR